MTRARDSNGQVTPLCESLLASAVLGSLVTPHLGCRCEEKKRKEKKKGREEDSCSSRKERRKSMDEEKTKRGIYKGREVVVVGTYVWWREKGKGAARAETEARAGATGSDLVILPSNPPCSSLRPLPSSIQPSTLNYRPPLNPFVRAFPVEDSRPSLSSLLHPRDFRLAFVLLGWNVLSLFLSIPRGKMWIFIPLVFQKRSRFRSNRLNRGS